METYDETVEDFQDYIDKLEMYLELYEINNMKKVSALWSLIGGEMYILLRGLTALEKPKTKPFDELVQSLQNHILPKPIISAERF